MNGLKGIDMELEFDVKINTSVLYDYMLYHTYTSFSGLFGSVVGALLIVAYGLNSNLYFLAAGLVVLLYIPWTLFFRAKKQVLANPAFKNPLHYKMTEEGVTVSQGEFEEFREWDGMFKANASNKSIFLYTSKINAWIFPKKDLDNRKDDIIKMISTHMTPDKVKIKQ